LIAGFPTETDAAFDNLVSLIDRCGLAFVHAFPFSPRSGAPAARMPQLDRRVVKERAARLREAGAAALRRHLDAWIGRSGEVLLERDGAGRLADFTSARVSGAAGQTQRFRFIAHDGAHLIGEPA